MREVLEKWIARDAEGRFVRDPHLDMRPIYDRLVALVERKHKEAQYITIGNTVGAGALIQMCDDVAAILYGPEGK